MNAAAAPRPAAVRPRLRRLTEVELRKTVDTRAGLWLLVVLALVAVGIAVAQWLGAPEDEHRLVDFTTSTTEALGVLLPVLGILAATSEWSQRTALTTFSLVPARERVVAAKLLAGTGLTLAAVALSLAASAAGVLAAGGAWELAPRALGLLALYQLVGVIGGMAFGLLLVSSPLAIVTYYVLPTAWAIIGETVPGMDGVADWLDLTVTLTPLADDAMAAGDWARLATSAAVWVGLPLAAGTARLLRREVA